MSLPNMHEQKMAQIVVYVSNDVRFISLGCIVFELSACENSAEFPAESGCKANELTRYKVDTARRVLPYI